MLHITSLYAAVLGLMTVWLASKPGFMRGKAGISIGDGGNTELFAAMRRHGNFIEWVPMTLILLGLFEVQGGPALALHIMGVGLIVSRLLHAHGIRYESIRSIPRAIGAFGNMLILLTTAIWLLVLHFT